MTDPVVTPMHNMDGDVPQPGDMVEDIVIIAVGLAATTEKPAIDHVMDQDSGGGQGVSLVWLAVAVFIAVEAAGTAFPGGAGRSSFHQMFPFCIGPWWRSKRL